MTTRIQQTQIKDYLMVYATIAAMMLVILGFIAISRGAWERGLRTQVQIVLDRELPGEYAVGEQVRIHSNASPSAALFALKSPQGRKSGTSYGLIFRLSTIFGPFPAVFLYDPGVPPRFVGLAFQGKEFSDQFTHHLHSQVARLERTLAITMPEEWHQGGNP
jgi:hypothetical protein